MAKYTIYKDNDYKRGVYADNFDEIMQSIKYMGNGSEINVFNEETRTEMDVDTILKDNITITDFNKAIQAIKDKY